jgi:hypothetical protein
MNERILILGGGRCCVGEVVGGIGVGGASGTQFDEACAVSWRHEYLGTNIHTLTNVCAVMICVMEHKPSRQKVNEVRRT